jgi:transcriptional regulator with XRE-family HTH domain
MLIGIQIVAARALLNITQEELSKATGINISTIKKTEGSRYEIYGSAERAMKLQKFFERTGITFIDNDKEIGCILAKGKSQHFSEK